MLGTLIGSGAVDIAGAFFIVCSLP
jgi:hypothetical protein